MPNIYRRVSIAAGFALAESLVALLLLSFATVGAGAAMVNSLAGQRAALLRTKAADLAANLAETLRSAPDAALRDAEIQRWQAAVLSQLPQAQSAVLLRLPAQPAAAGLSAPGIDIHVQWREGSNSALARLALPVALDAPAERP